MSATVILLLGLVVVAFVLLRRGRGSGAPAELRLVARAGLTQKAGLALVETGGRRYLVGYGDGPPSLLAAVPAAAADAGAAPLVARVPDAAAPPKGVAGATRPAHGSFRAALRLARKD